MARKRNLDPDLFSSEAFSSLGPWERLLYIGLWLHCDDEGRMNASTIEIGNRIFPQDKRSVLSIREWLTTLFNHKLIVIYPHEGKSFIYVVGMKDSQPFKHLNKSLHPPPPEVKYEPPPPEKESTVSPPRGRMGCVGLGRDGMGRDEELLLSPIGDLPEVLTAPPSDGFGTDLAADVARLWNSLAADAKLPVIERLSQKRRVALNARAREGLHARWSEFATALQGLPFYLGQNDRGWKADVDWLMRPDSWVGVIEKHKAPPAVQISAEAPHVRIAREAWAKRQAELAAERAAAQETPA